MFLFFGYEAHGIFAPWPGIEPALLALVSKVLTTGPPEKSLIDDWQAGILPFCQFLLPLLPLLWNMFHCFEKWKSLSPVWLFVTPQTIQSMEYSRPEYWSGLPFPPPGDLPKPGIKSRSPTLQADSLPTELSGKPLLYLYIIFLHADMIKLKIWFWFF